MRTKKLIATLISLLTVIVITGVVSFSAFATEEPDNHHTEYNVGEVTEAVTDSPATETEAQPQETEPVYEEPETQEVTEEETQAPTYYDVYGDTLPEVESQEVATETTMELPEVEVSDTSLLGGVIAWLCVALGIAVIAGVLVSQRTRQMNPSNKDNKRR